MTSDWNIEEGISDWRIGGRIGASSDDEFDTESGDGAERCQGSYEFDSLGNSRIPDCRAGRITEFAREQQQQQQQ